MKKIMIVDDEVLVRIGIKSMAVWENYGCTIVCDASDGEEALKKIEQFQPHIVLTDLKMQPMDGFTLISECAVKYPRIKFIVLSNYNDFDNVRRAMKLGAYDYVFKLTVHAEELLKIMEEAWGEMETVSGPDMEHVVYKNLDVIKNGLFKQALHKDGLFLDRVQKGFGELTLKIDWNSPYSVLSLQIDNLEIEKKKGDFLETDLLLFSMVNIITELMERGYRAEVFQYQDYDFAILINREENQSREEFEQMLKQRFGTLAKYISQYYGFGISGTVSREGRGIPYLPVAVEQNRKRFWTGFYRRSGLLVFWQEERLRLMALPDEYRLAVLDGMLSREEFLGVWKYLRGLLELCASAGDWNPEEIRTYLLAVCRKLNAGLSRHGIDVEKVKDKNGASMAEAITGYSFYGDMKSSLEEVLVKFQDLCKAEVKKPCRREIILVRQYVAEHVAEELTVFKLAEVAGMSESRFAHVFKDEMGVSFMEYANTVRMEKARELLQNTDMRVGEVGERIGIFNPNYFSAQYKKKTGQSPNEFRKSLLQQDLKET